MHTVKRPDDIPSHPQQVYKQEWSEWGDWLGTGNRSCRGRQWLPFAEAREYVHRLGLKNGDDWYAYCKSGQRPDSIPTDPRRHYKDDSGSSQGETVVK